MRLILVATIACFAAGSAFAQDTAQGPQNPAVKPMTQNNSSTPVAGENSFTMDQAKKQIEAKGYTKVTNLRKDQAGVWRGMAMKDGNSGPISVDYQGNVN